MKRALQTFSIFTTIGMFLVLIAGVLVTNSGSADGCGNSWPLCEGQFRPMETIASIIEYSHRAITGVVGIMVIVLAIWMWRAFPKRRDVKWLSLSSVFFVFVQAGLGAAAVVWPQSDAALALHFGLSSLALSSVFLLAVITLQKPGLPALHQVTKDYRTLVWGIFIYIYGVLYLGSFVRRVGASLSINTWPLNNGKLIPDHLFSLVGISFMHRLASLVALIVIIWLYRETKRHYPNRKDLITGSYVCLITIILQIFSGGYLIWAQLSLFSLMLHSTIVSVFFTSLSYICYQITVKEQK